MRQPDTKRKQTAPVRFKSLELDFWRYVAQHTDIKSNGGYLPTLLENRVQTPPSMPQITSDIPRQTSPSSSIFSSLIQSDVQPVPSIQSEDIIPPTEPQNTAHPHLPKVTHSSVQASDISSCSEVEEFLAASQQRPPRKKARKRRCITSKLSLSQSSHSQQPPQAADKVQIIKEVLHIQSSSSSSTSSSSTSSSSSSTSSSSSSSTSTSTSSLHTNAGTNRNPDPGTSSNIPMQEASFMSPDFLAPIAARAVHQPAKPPSSSGTNSFHKKKPAQSMTQELSFESQSLVASFVIRDVHQPAKPTKQSKSIHTLAHRQQGIKAGTVKPIHGATTHLQHTRNKASAFHQRKVTFQTPIASAVHGSGGHCEPDNYVWPEALNAGWQKDVTLMSTSDSDQSVYYDAASHLTIFNESCDSPSDIQNTSCLPTGQQGGTDSSSSFSSKLESDYTSHLLSSSGSSTCVPESLLNKTVISNKQSSGAIKRSVQEAFKERDPPASRKQIRRHEPQPDRLQDKRQLNPKPRTIRKDQTTSGWSLQRRQRQNHKEMTSPNQSTRYPWETMENEVSSSTSEPQSEGELSGQQVQETKRPLPRKVARKVASRLEDSVVSSSCSSSSTSSSVLTQEGMDCIQTIGEVFKQYFGGTVEDNLSLIQKNNYNLLECLIELQAAPKPPLPTQYPPPSPAPPQAPP
ncbi:uncharacterized protein LOC126981730 isoform X2 [Eriocheir sinensis]|uniref:uncharacterized protein LOC126981730 isoform X2 n=1 Tax=Eriocheir sinensis TaxID=95602 RepID=UPI0021CAAFB2|nr:uncharacterized protein LOC126981730 isoform X2 [Eriocheir sinensis]